MPRCQRVVLFAVAPFALTLSAAILPEGIEFHARKNPTPLKPEPAAVWKEYGLQEAEKADYVGKTGSFTVSAWRVADATAAQAAWQMLRPAGSAPSPEAKLAVKSGQTLLLVQGNYVFQFDRFTPNEETLAQLFLHVPRLDSSSFPALTGFLPPDGKIANSERYILGPESLAHFVPGIAPSVVAFHFGTEGQLARYKDKDGEVEMVLWNYPNPQIAKDRVAAFQELPQLVAKRSGPLVAVVTKTPNPDAAQRVLAGVRWEANVTLNQKMPDPQGDNIGVLIVNIFRLTGWLLVFCVVAGAAFAGIRIAGRKISGQKPGESEDVIGLHLQ